MAFTVGFRWRGMSSRRPRRDWRRTSKARARRHQLVPRPDALEDRRLLSLIPDPGGQTVYDTRTHTHWLADANAAADPANQFGVQGINPDGSMTWETAMDWVAALNQNHYLGHNDWFLPRTPNTDKTATQYNKKQHFSYGFDFKTSDMGELFYKEFGGTAGTTLSSLNNASTALFHNFRSEYYWGGASPRKLPADFSFNNGFLGTDVDIDFEYAIPEYPDAPILPVAPPKNNVLTIPRTPVVPSSLAPSSDGLTVYDANLNITWLADADLAAAQHFGVKKDINVNGSMSYRTAVAWIDAMNGADYLGHDDWRLPTGNSADKSGYDETDSELGELFYNELGGQAGSTIQLTHDSSLDLFNNIQSYFYRSGTDVRGKTHSHQSFSFDNGYRSGNTDPNEMYVIPVFDGPPSGPAQPTTLIVSNDHDTGVGSLRAAVNAAVDGDTVVFSPELAGSTIVLHSPINVDQAITIQGLGADSLTVSGGGSTGLFAVHKGAGAVTIAGLTLAKGQADQGGAILDDGASLTLTSDVFSDDKAAGVAPGQAASGGALAVLGGSTAGLAVTITGCQFTGDSATGAADLRLGLFNEDGGGLGQGGALYVDAGTSAGLSLSVTGTSFTGDSAAGGAGLDGLVIGDNDPVGGGNGQGGAVFLSAGGASQPSFSFVSATFSRCSAIGGQGGAGGTAVDGQDGAAGGAGAGGALDYTAGSAAAPSLSVTTSSFTANSAAAGAGGGSTKNSNASGSGGAGGPGTGGAILASFSDSAAGTITLSGDAVTSNAVQGGGGADAGPAGSGQIGGNGGAGGPAYGGGVAVTLDNDAAATGLTIERTEISSNTAQAGAAGAGGGTSQSKQGGAGGDGGDAYGVGLYLKGLGGADTWTLASDVIDKNTSAFNGRLRRQRGRRQPRRRERGRRGQHVRRWRLRRLRGHAGHPPVHHHAERDRPRGRRCIGLGPQQPPGWTGWHRLRGRHRHRPDRHGASITRYGDRRQLREFP